MEKLIHIDGLSYSYGKKTVFSNLSFSAEKGQCVVLAGPNGCGKSTALSIIAGALKPKGGTVTLGGKLSYIPQGTALFEDATVLENLRFFAGVAGTEFNAELESPEGAERNSDLPFHVGAYLKRRVSSLSGGMKKQVSIACALVGNPDIIILDEPCASLDIAFRDEVTALAAEWKKVGRTIVYACHDPLEFLPVFDTLVFLDDPPRIYARSEISSVDNPAAFCEFFKENLNKIIRR